RSRPNVRFPVLTGGYSSRRAFEAGNGLAEALRIRRLKLKINVVGERAVGKTSLIQRYVEARHNPEYKGTLGVHMHRVDVELPGDEEGDVIQANIAIFDQAVDAMMAGEKNRKVRNLLRQRILVFAARREGNGITKSELFANMQDVKPDEVMEELDNLVRLELLVQYNAGPKTFLKSSTLPATFRYQITPLGRKVAASP